MKSLSVLVQAAIGCSMLAAVAITPQDAQAKKKNIAKSGVGFGVSPFGGSFSYNHHQSAKLTYQFAFGGLPESDVSVTVNDVEYDNKGSSSWGGAFINYRPLKKARWFRLNTGLAVGQIDNKLEDSDGNSYRIKYTENPVFYTGIGFGATARKGFSMGFDLGFLHTGGPVVTAVEGNGAAAEDLEDSLFFGSRLPNAQLFLGWNY